MRVSDTLRLAAVALALAACAGTSGGGHRTTPRPELVPPPADGDPAVVAAAAPANVERPGPAVPPQATTAPAERNYQTIRIKVSGMTCPIRCVREVTEQLQAVTGVLHVTIDHDRREAIVDVAPGTDPESVLAGLRAPYAGRLL